MTWPRVKVAGSFRRRFSGNRVLTIHSPTPSLWYMRSEKSSAWLQKARRGCPSGGASLVLRAHSATCHSHTLRSAATRPGRRPTAHHKSLMPPWP